MPVVGPLAPLGLELPERRLDERGLLDRVHAAAVAPAGLRQARVSGLPGDRDRRHQAAAAGHPDVEAGRLGDDPRVGPDAVCDRGDAAGAGRFLVGDRVHEQIAVEPDAESRQRLGRERHRRDAALHVHGAAAVEPPLAHDRRERIARPALARLDRDHVDVAVQEQAAAASAAWKARDELRAVPRSRGRAARAGCPRRPPEPAPRGRPRRRARPADLRDSAATPPRRGPDRPARAQSCRTGSDRPRGQRARRLAPRSRRGLAAPGRSRP